MVWVREGARDAASARRVTDSIRIAFASQELPRARYANLIDEMPGPDVGDHAHAAAAVSIAPSVLVTANLKDFPAASLARRGVTVRTADAHALDLLDGYRSEVLGVIEEMAAARRRPPMTVSEVCAALAGAGLRRFSAEVGKRRA